MNESMFLRTQCPPLLRRWARVLAIAGLVGLTGGALRATPINVYVATTGSDTTGTGTSAAPWASIAKARLMIQSLSHADDIIVNVKAGEYVIKTPIAFSAADSGGTGHSVIYQSVDGIGAAKLVGAPRLSTTGWASAGSSMWSISLGATNTPAVATIYENGKRAWMARQPNLVPSTRYPLAHSSYALSASGGQGGGSDWLVYNSGEFSNITSWVLGASASVLWWKESGTADWNDDAPNKITTAPDTVNRKIFCASYSTTDYPSTERYLVQGILQLLDANGEFFYDATAGNLTYRTLDGTTANNAAKDIRAPLNAELLNLIGTVGSHIHDIQFSGFKIAYTANRGVGATDGAINLQYTDHILIQNCEFSQMGALAVSMTNSNANNTVTGCWIHNAGIGGIAIVDLLPRAGTTPNTSADHLISNCKINDIGEIDVNGIYTAGVLIWSTQNSTVTHCDISRSGRYAISLRGNYSTQVTPNDLGYNPSSGNTFSYIRVTDCLQDSGDAGEVHAAECNATGDTNINFWNQITIAGAYADPSMHGIAPNGIFLDHAYSCQNQNFSNVDVTWTAGAPLRTNNNPTQTTSNVSWGVPPFDPSLMDYSHIGLGSDFPFLLASDDPDNPSSLSPTVIADDHTSEYTESDSAWADSTIGSLRDGDGRYHNHGAATLYAEWAPRLPYTGTYQVYAWQMGLDSGASTVAPFTVYDNTGSSTTYVNQQTGIVGTWVSLGTHRLTMGVGAASGYVQLAANTSDGKAIRADAVKFVLQGTPLAAIGDEKGWWTLDNVLCDDSGHGLTAASMPTGSGPTFVANGGEGGLVSCATFDGVDDYLDVPNNAGMDIGTGDFAISVWFYRTTSTAGDLRILSKGAGLDSQKGYTIYASDTGLTVVIGNGTTRLYTICNHSALNNWNHLVVNISRSGTMSLYINGTLQSGATDISAWNGVDLSANTVDLNIGRNVNVGQYWTGMIGAVRLYQRTLTAAEIATLAANP